MTRLLDISDVAAQSGVPASALRYYEEIGLIESFARKGLRRQFPAHTLLQLALIQLGRAAGFSLSEIRAMFGAGGSGARGQPEIPRSELLSRADEIERQISDLGKLRDMLRHVANCPAPTHMECPKFRQLLHAASRRGAADAASPAPPASRKPASSKGGRRRAQP